MQYIKKQNIPPSDWDKWFTTATGKRSYDYKTDYSALTQIENARAFLIAEQSELCAYCQKTIKLADSSIEHIVPKEQNIELSTNYHNLVAVCKTQVKDSNGQYHCDKAKVNKPITPFIFLSNSDVIATKTEIVIINILKHILMAQ